MRTGTADDRDHQRRAREPAPLMLDLIGRGVRTLVAKHRGDGVAGLEPRVALEHDEPPGRQLAVVGHSRGDSEQGRKLVRGWAGAIELDRLDRTPRGKKIDGFGHGKSAGGSVMLCA